MSGNDVSSTLTGYQIEKTILETELELAYAAAEQICLESEEAVDEIRLIDGKLHELQSKLQWLDIQMVVASRRRARADRKAIR